MPKIEPVRDEELQSILPPDLFVLWRAIVAKYVLRFWRGGKTLASLFSTATC